MAQRTFPAGTTPPYEGIEITDATYTAVASDRLLVEQSGQGFAVTTAGALAVPEDITLADGAFDFDVASHDATNGLKLGGTLVSATAAELNRVADGSAKIIAITAATITITQALHANRIVTLDRAGGIVVTMPDNGTGATGDVYTFVVLTTFTSNATIVLPDTTNTSLIGGALIADSGASTAHEMFTPGATFDLVTLDGTNTGGGLGCRITYTDVANDVWSVEITEYVGGTAPATPFSST